MSGASVVYVALSCLAIAAGVFIGPLLDVQTLELGQLAGVAIVLLANTILGWGVPITRWVPACLTFFGIWLGLWHAVDINYAGVFMDYTF